MNPEYASELLKTMMVQAVTLAAPVLLTAMVIGLAVSLFQAVTTIHEQTLTFVPKALGIVTLLVILLPWMLRSLIEFTMRGDSADPANGTVIDPTNWFLVFARAGALLSVFPLTSTQNVPVRLRVVLGALVAYLVAPMLPEPPPGVPSLWSLVGTLFLEISVGLLLGFICKLVFYAVEVAGNIIATDLGLMMSSNFNPLSSNVATSPAMILYWLAMMLLLTLDLHHWVLAAFQRTYELLQIGAARLSEALLTDVVSRTGGIFVIAVRVAAPMIAVSFIIMLVFSVLGRAVPQMNVFAESFPVRTMAGLTVFGLTCSLMAQHIAAYLHRIPEDMIRIAHLLRG